MKLKCTDMVQRKIPNPLYVISPKKNIVKSDVKGSDFLANFRLRSRKQALDIFAVTPEDQGD